MSWHTITPKRVVGRPGAATKSIAENPKPNRHHERTLATGGTSDRQRLRLSPSRGGSSAPGARCAGTLRLRRRTREKKTARRKAEKGQCGETHARWCARLVSSSPPLVLGAVAVGVAVGTLEMRPATPLKFRRHKDKGGGWGRGALRVCGAVVE